MRQHAAAPDPASSADSASPLQMTRRKLAQARTASSQPLQTANDTMLDETPAASTARSAASSRHAGRSSRPAAPDRGALPAPPPPAAPPSISGQKNSHTETSKPNGVFCSTASSRAEPHRRPASRPGGCADPRGVLTDAFRRAGRARGVDHIGRVRGSMQIAERWRAPCDSAPVGVEPVAIEQRPRSRQPSGSSACTPRERAPASAPRAAPASATMTASRSAG